MTSPARPGGRGVFLIGDELKEFIEGGQAVCIATADARARPHLTMAWGPIVTDGGRAIAFFVESEKARQAVADAVETGMVAITVASPVSYQSLQFKGRCTGTRLATAEEGEWVDRHRDAFLSATSLVGDPPRTIRNLFLAGELRRFEVAVEAAFDQTPGPGAGAPL